MTFLKLFTLSSTVGGFSKDRRVQALPKSLTIFRDSSVHQFIIKTLFLANFLDNGRR